MVAHLEGQMDAKGNFTGMKTNATVTVRNGLSGSVLRGAVAHEGSHISDVNAFGASFGNGGNSWSDSLNILNRQSEMRAYAITAEIANATNTPFNFDVVSSCRLWLKYRLRGCRKRFSIPRMTRLSWLLH
jgi:hypothetical protein